MNNKFYVVKMNGNERLGFLSSLEANMNVPFDIKRIYYIYNVPIKTKRGMHAHKTLQQILWCPYGEIEVILDNGKEKVNYLLDSPDKTLLVLKGNWHDMYWKKEGSVLCVAASEYYDEEDYIRDYDQFIKYVEEGYWDDENQL